MSEKVVGYIIVNPNTEELDWDGQLHPTKNDAIDSLTGFHDPFCKTEAERSDERRPWWDDYSIHPVLDRIEHPND